MLWECRQVTKNANDCVAQFTKPSDMEREMRLETDKKINYLKENQKYPEAV
jgi:hypothetical protein